FKIIGEYRVFIQIFNSALFSLTVLATYMLGKELWDDETGFYSGLFLAGIPYLIIQVPLMMVDISTMFLLTLSILLFTKAIRHGGYKNILLSAIVIFFTMLTKYSVWLMLFVLPLISVVFAKGSVRDVVLRSLKVTGIAVTMCLFALLLKYEMFIEQIAILRTYQWPALSNWSEGFISTFFFQSHPFLIVLASFGAYRAMKERDKRFLVPVWFAVFIIVLRVERIRYIIPLFPLFTLMASYGLMKIRLEDIRRFILYCVVGLSLVVVYSGYSPFLKSTSMANLQNAGRYIDSLGSTAVMAYTLPQKVSTGNTDIVVPILDIYTSKEIAFKQALELPADVPDLEGSPLRFTWEFRMPDFYSDILNTESAPVIVISSDQEDMLIPKEVSLTYPPDNELMKIFDVSSRAFRFKSLVYIYGRPALSVSGQ
ncbi:MAG: glycosyltransferase family 39 protein, partial [Thermodesulfovibrionales bacterium]